MVKSGWFLPKAWFLVRYPVLNRLSPTSFCAPIFIRNETKVNSCAFALGWRKFRVSWSVGLTMWGLILRSSAKSNADLCFAAKSSLKGYVIASLLALRSVNCFWSLSISFLNYSNWSNIFLLSCSLALNLLVAAVSSSLTDSIVSLVASCLSSMVFCKS